MPRLPRIQFKGAIYHVIFRGNDRRNIFRDDADRVRFLEGLESRVADYQTRLFLFCLMDNHVHLVLQTPLANVSDFMGSLLTAYGTYFNRRHRRSGHLTQGRFKSPLVEENAHLLQLSRYIHLNPVKTKAWEQESVRERRAFLRSYAWSSYPSYIGKVRPLPFIDYSMALNQVAPKRGKQRAIYRKYVEEGLSNPDKELEEAMSRSPLAIGSVGFVEEVTSGFSEQEKAVPGERGKARAVEVSAEAIMKATCSYFGIPAKDVVMFRKRDRIKPVLSKLLMKYAGMRQQDIAPLVGVTTSAAVSVQIRKVRDDSSGELEKAFREVAERIAKTEHNY